MRGGFNRAFNNKITTSKIPEAILKELSSKLPEGFRYVQVDKESCQLVSTTGEHRICVDLDENNEFNAKNIDEFSEYLYRTQKIIKTKSKCISINGHKFTVNEIMKFPLTDIKLNEDSGEFCIIPSPFPRPFDLEIGIDNGETMNLKIQRKPYANLNKALFESINSNALKLSYIIDERENSMSMNLKINMEKAKTVAEIIAVAKIYESFMKGNITIGDCNIKGSVKPKDNCESLEGLIKFWQNVEELSNKLNLNLEPKEEIFKKDVKLIDTLYESFIEKKDSIEVVNGNGTFRMSFDSEINMTDFKANKRMTFQSVEHKKINILDKEKELYCVTTLSNFKVDDIIQDKDELYIHYIRVSPSTEDGIIIAIRYFINEKDVNNYIEVEK